MTTPRKETYQIQGREFVKEYRSGGAVAFFCDGREIGAREWNELLNVVQPMNILEEHANPLIKMKEKNRRSDFVKFIGSVAGKVVADIGCEDGWLSEALAADSARLYCVDIDEAMLRKTAARVGPSGKVEYVASDIRELPFGDSTLDLCIAAEVLEHIPDTAVGIAELVRVTKPAGLVIISVPNERLVLAAKKVVKSLGAGRSLGRLSSGIAVGHVRVFTPGDLRGACDGLVEIEKLRYSHPFPFNIFSKGRPRK